MLLQARCRDPMTAGPSVPAGITGGSLAEPATATSSHCEPAGAVLKSTANVTERGVRAVSDPVGCCIAAATCHESPSGAAGGAPVGTAAVTAAAHGTASAAQAA